MELSINNFLFLQNRKIHFCYDYYKKKPRVIII